MHSNSFFDILKKIKRYAYFESGEDINGKKPKFQIDPNHLQANYKNKIWVDYQYLISDDKNKYKQYSLIHAYLQGALKERKKNKKKYDSPDTSFIDYQKNELKLFFGMFCFIDPTKQNDPEKQRPYYLLGPMVGKDIKAHFNLRILYNQQNFRGSYEFTDLPEKWLNFFLAFNEYTRDVVPFKGQDFVRLFNNKNYVGKRNSIIEKENNLLYIPSGEMDHCCLQWFFLRLSEAHPEAGSPSLNSPIALNINKTFLQLGEFYTANRHKDYFIPNYHELVDDKPADSFVTPGFTLKRWLTLWGLLEDNGAPTERFLAVLEWFYFYLFTFTKAYKDKEPYYNFQDYLCMCELPDEEKIYLANLNQDIITSYLELSEKLLPVTNDHFKAQDYLSADYAKLIEHYINIISGWNEKCTSGLINGSDIFSERCRFRPMVHFLFRNFSSSCGEHIKEKTCRGFIFFPTLKNNDFYTDAGLRGKEDLTYIGYFIGLFKDSDEKGRCIFNWHKRSDFKTISKSVSEAYSDGFFELRHVISLLGRIEIEQTYFKGIVQLHYQEHRKQALLNAIAALTARTKSHNTGSHFLGKLVTPDSVDLSKVVSDEKLDYRVIGERELGAFKKAGITHEIDKLRTGKLEFLAQIENGNNNPDRKEFATEIINQEAAKSYYNRLVSYAFSYLKTRDELLADFISTTPGIYTSKNFLSEIMMELDANRLLLNRISGVDGFKFRFDFEGLIKVPCSGNYSDPLKDSLDLQVAISNDLLGQHCFYIILENIIRNTAKHSGLNVPEFVFTIRIEVSTTDNTYYRVTLYDNIVKDKHVLLCVNKLLFKAPEGQEKKIEPPEDNGGFVQLGGRNTRYEYIRNCDEDHEYFTSQCNDNPLRVRYAGCSGDHHYFLIKEADLLVTEQNIRFNRKILEQQSNVLRADSLGLAEMKVCAAYLRQIPMADVDNDEFNIFFSDSEIEKNVVKIKENRARLPFIYAINPPKQMFSIKGNRLGESIDCLGYCFYLPKPKDLLIIDDDGTLWSKLQKAAYQYKPRAKDDSFRQILLRCEKHGILILNASGMHISPQYQKWVYKKDTRYSHKMLLMTGKQSSFSELATTAKPSKYNFYNLPHKKILYHQFKERFIYHYTQHADDYREIFPNPNLIDFLEIVTEVDKETRPGIEKLDLLKIEVLRAIGHQQFEHKELYPYPGDRLGKRLAPFSKGNPFYFDFYEHGEGFSAIQPEFFDGYIEITEGKFKRRVEQFRGQSQIDYDNLSHISTLLSNVLILDERIQEYGRKAKYKLKKGPEKSIMELWKHCNVIIPERDTIDLNKTVFDTDYPDIIKKMEEEYFGIHTSRSSKGVDFILIHLGIIEKLMDVFNRKYNKNNPDDIRKFLKYLFGGAMEKGCKIIITSGRAPSANRLPDDIAFLNFSSVLNCIIENRFKYFLIQLLETATPKTN